MFKVTVEGDSPASLKKALLAAAAMFGEGSPRTAVEADEPAPKAKTKAKPAPEPEEDEDEAPPPKAKAKAKPAPADDSELTYDDDVRPAVVAFSKKYGRDPMLEALGAFTDPATDEPATHAQQLDADDWARFLKSMKKIGARIDAED